MQKTRGFSLIELMVAVTIMALLAGIVGFGVKGLLAKTKKTATVSTLKNLETAIESYYNDIGSYPALLSDLVNKPADPKLSKKWEGPYLKKAVTEDAWGTEFVYQVTKGGKHQFELYSWGPNKEGSPEDEHLNVWDL